MYKKILLPTDGSEYAHKAAKHTIQAANVCSADIIVLNVVESSKLPEIIAVDVERKLINMLTEEGNTALDNVSGRLDKFPEIMFHF